MDCPHCGKNLTLAEAARTRCRHCGRRLDRNLIGLVKTSSVRIAVGDSDQVYASIEALPPDLRKKLQQAIGDPDTETILIADEKGREQIFEVIQGLPPDVQKRALSALRLPAAGAPFWSATTRALLLFFFLAVLMLAIWWIWRR
jgi:hypothetical protein